MKNIGRVAVLALVCAGFFSCAQKNTKPGPTPEPVNGKVMLANVYLDPNDACPLCLRYVQVCLVEGNGRGGLEDALIEAFTRKGYGTVKGKLSDADKLDKDAVSRYAELAKKLNAEYLAMPVLYCWGERSGSAVSASRTARVGFHLHIYDPETGKEIWGGDLNEWQAPLSDNILDVPDFIARGGRWVSARDLAISGALKLIDKFQKELAKNAADTGD